MKKYLFFLLLLAIGAMSCQKDIELGSINAAKTNEVTLTDNKQKSLFNENKPHNDANVFKKIKDFKALLDKIHSGILTENQNEMTVNETVWNIEALLNAQYCTADASFKKDFLGNGTIAIPLNTNGNIDANQLLTVFEAARLKLAEQYTAVTGDKSIIIVDMSVNRIENQTGYFNISSVIGDNSAENSPFGPDDNWLFAFRLGRCNGTNAGEDAGTKIATQLNLRYPIPTGASFFTDVYTERLFGVGYDTIQGGSASFRNPNDDRMDNKRDYLIYQTSSEYDNFLQSRCIVASDMNWYYQNLFDYITRIKSWRGLDFGSISIAGDNHSHLDPVTGEAHSLNLFGIVTKLGTYQIRHCRTVCRPDRGYCTYICLD